MCVSAKLVRLYRTHWTPAYFIWDPLQSAAGSYGTREKRKCPYGDPFVSKLVPDETHGSSKLGGGSGFRPRILKSPWPLAPEP
jgi:hypothetical protein